MPFELKIGVLSWPTGSLDQSSPFLITPNEIAHILILECIHFFSCYKFKFVRVVGIIITFFRIIILAKQAKN